MIHGGFESHLRSDYDITLSMSVDALDGLPALTFGSKENFWEGTIHDKRTSATFYARPTPINIPARSISDY